MPYEKGNQFWLYRSQHGPEALFNTPELLWEAACEYFQGVNDNPITSTNKAGITEKKRRPYTILALCLYLDCSQDWFYKMERRYKEQNHEAFLKVISNIRAVITTQKFEGAAAGDFNATIISRDLGLIEQTANQLSGPEGGPIQTNNTIKVEFVEPNKAKDD